MVSVMFFSFYSVTYRTLVPQNSRSSRKMHQSLHMPTHNLESTTLSGPFSHKNKWLHYLFRNSNLLFGTLYDLHVSKLGAPSSEQKSSEICINCFARQHTLGTVAPPGIHGHCGPSYTNERVSDIGRILKLVF